VALGRIGVTCSQPIEMAKLRTTDQTRSSIRLHSSYRPSSAIPNDHGNSGSSSSTSAPEAALHPLLPRRSMFGSAQINLAREDGFGRGRGPSEWPAEVGIPQATPGFRAAGAPRSRPSALKSSSRSGQWMPNPPPASLQLARCSAVA
jgi:hypothetical protein